MFKYKCMKYQHNGRIAVCLDKVFKMGFLKIITGILVVLCPLNECKNLEYVLLIVKRGGFQWKLVVSTILVHSYNVNVFISGNVKRWGTHTDIQKLYLPQQTLIQRKSSIRCWMWNRNSVYVCSKGWSCQSYRGRYCRSLLSFKVCIVLRAILFLS